MLPDVLYISGSTFARNFFLHADNVPVLAAQLDHVLEGLKT